MKTILLITSLLLATTVVFSQSGWLVLNSSYTNNINDIIVFDGINAKCVGGSATAGNVLTTSDGGTTWATQTVGTSELNAIAGTTTAAWVVGNGGAIYKTINGTTWASQSSGVTTDLNDVQFPSATTGYAVGGSGVILKTTTGTSWSNPIISGGTTYTINSVFFTDASNGVVAGEKDYIQGFFSRTVSGGTYFGAATTSLSIINSVDFTSSSTGYAAAESGNIFKTTNSGTSWTPLSTGTTSNINSIHFSDANNGYAVGDGGLILHTTNGGFTWVAQNSPTIENLNSVYCHSNDTVYAVGDNGTIIKTISAGAYLVLDMPDDSIYCNSSATIIANPAYSGSGTLTYTWTSNGPAPISIIGNTIITGNINQSYDYYCTVTDGALSSTDTMTIFIEALPTDSICLVTVDNDLGYNVVVFEKHIQGAIDYYKIYAETSVANIYDSIGFIPADSVGIFVDTNSNPAVKAYSYKISTVDSCGNESALSNKHKTMHLTINQGAGSSWNLIWNYYEGIPVQTYRIWRADPNMNWTKIDSVGGLNSSFTDINPPAGPLYYQVEIISPYICQPYDYKANTNYNSSRSNTANNGIIPTTLSADFDADFTSGAIPLNVQFNNLSQGDYTAQKWYFGDGTTDTSLSPSHIYTSEGLYTVKLVISNNSGSDSITKTDYIDAIISGININNKEHNIEIYPNPINKGKALTISHRGNAIKEINIFNILGKTIPFKTIISKDKTIINMGDIAKGIYFITFVETNGNRAQRKFIVK